VAPAEVGKGVSSSWNVMEMCVDVRVVQRFGKGSTDVGAEQHPGQQTASMPFAVPILWSVEMCFLADFVRNSDISVSNVHGTPWSVGPCHHGMARPQVADGGTASNLDGSCEYIE
jgi:hypothetical protein